ncbi:hypothetical protein ABFS82_09G104100 [Erythranthe guttata]|uniref:Uncharacterized protein n=1 Tax=Erythranthe guttata TaxID=4155 RepID=A0A022Q0J1_ERYGU|nr:PREDICTED: uncharacterized protein LOC105975680 [Erythranthe guttata]EYU21531.1 hypothetical protein MIMGU_mgv1a015938mg [Erythranthe guttata]|eukprot:XP_012856336.1 PREDICTED: uncharacterized protein LOC105975680 [Erythranthe guttata]
MAILSLSFSLPASTPKAAMFLAPSSTSTSFMASSSNALPLLPPLNSVQTRLSRGRRRSGIVAMAPDEEKMTRRSPLDFPIEWDRPKPGRRPDIFPQFSPMKTPLPPPMPCDPDEEDEEDEEDKKEEDEEDPDKEDPDKQE